jgi:hypothetical protein
MEVPIMKRSTTKKLEKPAAKEQEEQLPDDSAWLNVMRETLSPYWSARIEHTSDRASQRDNNEEAA